MILITLQIKQYLNFLSQFINLVYLLYQYQNTQTVNLLHSLLNIYLFNANGEKIFSYKHSYASGLYYTLSAQKINQEKNFYYYLFGYISGAESDLNLYYCRINLVNKKIDYLSSLTRYKINVKSQGLSCQFISNESNDYIMCLYNYNPESQNYLYVSIFDFDETGITLSDHNRFKKLQNTTYIQSAIKSKNSKPFFCGLLDNGKSYCLIYDYYDFYNENENNNSFISWDRKNEKKCKIKPYNVKTYYFPETDQYVFSCLTEDNGVQTTFYKKNMTQMSEIKNRSLSLQTEFTGCDEFYYSIVYSKINNKFYILSDIDCEPYKQFIPIAEGEIDIIEESKTEEEIYENEEKEIEKEKLLEEIIEEEIEESNSYFAKKEIIEEEKEKLEEKNNVEEIQKIEREEEEKEAFECYLDKCSGCNEESIKKNLCLKCNIEKGYYPFDSSEDLNIMINKYIDCYNEKTKKQGLYLDKEIKKYKLCYSNCKTCNFGGNGIENNCTSCKNNQIFKPDILNSTNCVSQCTYFYYYRGMNYKCTETEICPDNYQLEIKEKKKCIDKCENDDTYNIQYDGECYNKTPEGTKYDEILKISKDIDIEKCKLNEKKLRLISNENITENEIVNKAKLYAKEFDYTDTHVTVYKNDFYSITLYKDNECLSKLDLVIDQIDF